MKQNFVEPTKAFTTKPIEERLQVENLRLLDKRPDDAWAFIMKLPPFESPGAHDVPSVS